jgi:hypothetical protein
MLFGAPASSPADVAASRAATFVLAGQGRQRGTLPASAGAGRRRSENLREPGFRDRF